MEKIVKYLPYLGLLLAFAVTATYALKAEWIKDYLLNWTEKAYGDRSLAFRMQKWFVGAHRYGNRSRLFFGYIYLFDLLGPSLVSTIDLQANSCPK